MMGCGNQSHQDVSYSTLSLPAATPGEFDFWRKTSTRRGGTETEAILVPAMLQSMPMTHGFERVELGAAQGSWEGTAREGAQVGFPASPAQSKK